MKGQMNILIIGGEKTHNIVSAVGKNFRKSVIDFLELTDIGDIRTLQTKGETFDKALIMEAGITNNQKINDREFSQRMQEVTNYIKAKYINTPFLWIAKDNNSGKIISEETFGIKNSKVLILEMPYKVKDITQLIVNDIQTIDEKMFYKDVPTETDNGEIVWASGTIEFEEGSKDV